VRPTVSEPTSNALTEGIRVIVQSIYLPEQSSPEADHYAFAYTVAIVNEGDVPAQLRTRHWLITDADGDIRHVRGDGVVGKQPRLQPGESFQYTSSCMLPTPMGTMHGTYQMVRDDGSQFDAEIAPFTLAWPLIECNRVLN
jgi:ApaG protein